MACLLKWNIMVLKIWKQLTSWPTNHHLILTMEWELHFAKGSHSMWNVNAKCKLREKMIFPTVRLLFIYGMCSTCCGNQNTFTYACIYFVRVYIYLYMHIYLRVLNNCVTSVYHDRSVVVYTPQNCSKHTYKLTFAVFCEFLVQS